jgi:hypothetical protein
MDMITQIISGGQTGADRAGLDTAKRLGIPTGGMAPRGFRTEDGPDLSLRDIYGLKESISSNYSVRTWHNAKHSDGTVLFGDMSSAGSSETMKACRQTGKPCLKNPTADELVAWIQRNKIKILNVAGNRASRNPAVYEQTTTVLTLAIERLRQRRLPL